MTAGSTPPGQPGGESTVRLEAFSDGVFAIAITLLVLELGPPELAEGQRGFGDVLGGLWRLWPQYLAYVVSFLTIGNAWISHHNLFRLITRMDQTLVVLNTSLLLFVAFIPYPTSLISEYPEGGGARAVMLVYGATFTILAMLYAVLSRYATSDRRLVGPEIPQAVLDAMSRRYLLSVPLYLAATLLSLLVPGSGPQPILLLTIFYPLSFPIMGGLSRRWRRHGY